MPRGPRRLMQLLKVPSSAHEKWTLTRLGRVLKTPKSSLLNLLRAGPPLGPEVNPEPASIAPARLEPAGTVPTDIAERLKATLPSNKDATAAGDQDPAIAAAARALTLLSTP